MQTVVFIKSILLQFLGRWICVCIYFFCSMFPFSPPKWCPDCAPTLHRSHREQKFQNTINYFVEYIFPDTIFMGIKKYLHPYILRCFFSFLHVVRILQEREIGPETPIHNRSRVVLDEATKR